MMKTWRKHGLVFKPENHFDWMSSHASVPTVESIDDSRLRIYFGTRDKQNRNHITRIDVEAADPQKIIEYQDYPILSPGKIGTFDDCGVMPSSIVTINQDKYMFYTGWNVRNTIPYHNSIGMAVSNDNGITFTRFAEGPLLDRTIHEPYFCTVPFVLVENGVWRMWYSSCTKWVTYQGKPEPYYHIKYAESLDGVNWKREGIVCIDFKNEYECGIVRPVVQKEDGIYKMWYSYRNLDSYRTLSSNSYRIGYAESSDGISWDRKDDLAGIEVSEDGWDSQMIEYPYVLNIDQKKLLFYNGNTFGKSGIGYASSIRGSVINE